MGLHRINRDDYTRTFTEDDFLWGSDADAPKKNTIEYFKQFFGNLEDITDDHIVPEASETSSAALIDTSIPRLWVKRRFYAPSEFGTGNHTAYTHTNYLGAYDDFPAVASLTAGKFFFHREHRAFYSLHTSGDADSWNQESFDDHSGPLSVMGGADARWLGSHYFVEEVTDNIDNWDGNLHWYYYDEHYRDVRTLTTFTTGSTPKVEKWEYVALDRYYENAPKRVSVTGNISLSINPFDRAHNSPDLVTNAVTWSRYQHARIKSLRISVAIGTRYISPITIDKCVIEQIGYHNYSMWSWVYNNNIVPALYWSEKTATSGRKEHYAIRPNYFQLSGRTSNSYTGIVFFFNRFNTSETNMDNFLFNGFTMVAHSGEPLSIHKIELELDPFLSQTTEGYKTGATII